MLIDRQAATSALSSRLFRVLYGNGWIAERHVFHEHDFCVSETENIWHFIITRMYVQLLLYAYIGLNIYIEY